MNTQPKALRVADALYDAQPEDLLETYIVSDAADELRRLHNALMVSEETAERCRTICDATAEQWRADVNRLHALNQELLEALELMYACYADPSWISYKQQEKQILNQTRAAIAKAEGEKQ